jgi:enamine deaminase RidA (YjgF/YER057c/UK114 family)
MSVFDQSLNMERRVFLSGASAAGMASVLAPGAALAQASAPAARSSAEASAVVSAQRLLGGAVNHAYAVKAGPFVFLNGHEGYDFAAGLVPAVEGPPGYPEYGAPRLRREADFIFERMGRLLGSSGTDFAHSVRLDQYYTKADAVRAYHLARFAALGKYVPPSTSIITERCFGGRSSITTSLVAVTGGDPQWEVRGVYPEGARVSPFSGYAPAVVANDFVFAAGAGPEDKDMLDTDPPQGPHRRWGSVLPIRRQAESALKRIEGTLKAAGTSLANCLKAQVHVAGEENIPDFVDVWNEHVGSSPAALTVTPAKGFASVEMILEINYILLREGARRKKEIVRADIPQLASYSPAVRAGELVFSPGLLPLTRDGTVAGLAQGEDFPGLCLRSQLQAGTIYDHAEAIAKAAGLTMRHAVRIDYWVSDIREFPGVALAWAGRYGDAPHPFACVVTPTLAAPGATVMADFWFYAG